MAASRTGKDASENAQAAGISPAGISRAGISPAVLRVLTENHARFLQFLERRTRRRDVAEEILQEAFVRSIARGGGLRDDESAVAWFYRVLRNALTDHARHAAAEDRALASVAAEAAAAEGTFSGTAANEVDRELLAAVCGCIASLVGTLKSEYAEAISSVELGDEDVAGFAARVGITPGNAAVRLFRARQALRRRVEQTCGTCATHGCFDCQCRSEPHG